MKTLNFLDANVLPALPWNRHSFSEQAVSFERASDEQFFFCRFTQITALRLLTAESRGTEAQFMAQAWNGWNRVWKDDRLKFLREPDDLEREFRLHSRSHSPSPKVWADAYLLAFAAVPGLQLVTFHRAIKPLGVSVLHCDIEQGHQWKARLTQSYTEGYWGKVTQIATW